MTDHGAAEAVCLWERPSARPCWPVHHLHLRHRILMGVQVRGGQPVSRRLFFFFFYNSKLVSGRDRRFASMWPMMTRQKNSHLGFSLKPGPLGFRSLRVRLLMSRWNLRSFSKTKSPVTCTEPEFSHSTSRGWWMCPRSSSRDETSPGCVYEWAVKSDSDSGHRPGDHMTSSLSH